METSRHVIDRLTNRLDGIVTPAEVQAALQKIQPQPRIGKTWILVKRLPKVVRLEDSSTLGVKVFGSEVWAIVRRSGLHDPGCLATVMLVNAGKAREPRSFYVF
jgi:hypothetical protein